MRFVIAEGCPEVLVLEVVKDLGGERGSGCWRGGRCC